jgi:hypothetical protein
MTDNFSKNLDLIDWELFSANPNAINILLQHMDRINWYWLSMNQNAIPLLFNNVSEIDFNALSFNEHFSFNKKTYDVDPYSIEIDWIFDPNNSY